MKTSKKPIHIRIDPNKWDDISRQLPGISLTLLVDHLLNDLQTVLSETKINLNELNQESIGRTLERIK